MFQYAFGLAAATALATELEIDDSRLRELFVLGHHEPARDACLDRVVRVENDEYEEPDEVLAQLTDDATYVGYFQSERFFASVRTEVRAAFSLRPEHVRAFEGKYASLTAADYICVHMRRTDYHTFAGGVALPMSYYESALESLGPAATTPIVFVGDDLAEAAAAFGKRDEARFEHNDEAVDLQLLEHAAAVVASNSSFAWWGSWLNPRPDKRVIAPRHWLGYGFGWEYPPRVIPPEWEQIRVKLPLGRRLAPAHLRMSLGRTRRDIATRFARR